MAGDTKHIIQSLGVNAVICVAKGIGAFFTGSGAMLAETLHSGADCANQLLLLMGVKRAGKPADERHPLGYGRALYFWSFIVALLLFTGGGVYSLYEGIHKTIHPEPLDNVYVAMAILAFSIALEATATFSNMKELNKRRGEVPFFRFLRETTDSDLVVVFGENSAATLGLILALLAITVAHLTGDPHWDGIGTIAIGVVLVAVAVFLAVELESLLLGEAADEVIVTRAKAVAAERPQIKEIYNIISLQQGPGEVLFAAKIRMAEHMTFGDVCAEVNRFEGRMRDEHPELKWMFVEPDIPDGAASSIGFRQQVLDVACATPGVERITRLNVMPMDHDQVMLGMKVRFPTGVRIEEVEAIIDNLEKRVHEACPEVKKIWVEPDDHLREVAPTTAASVD